jgi:hypothetical protein
VRHRRRRLSPELAAAIDACLEPDASLRLELGELLARLKALHG